MAELVNLFRKAERREDVKADLGEAVRMLTRILGLGTALRGKGIAEKARIIEEAIGRAAGHSIMNLMREFSWEDEISYPQAVRNCATEYLGIKRPSSSVARSELMVMRRFLERTWKSLPKAERENVRSALINEAERNGVNSERVRQALASATPLTLLIASEMGGFGIYLAATSALAFVSEATGIALGFGAYTALTRGLAIALGPFELTLSILFDAYQIGKPAYGSKVLPSIIVVANLRQRMRYRRGSQVA